MKFSPLILTHHNKFVATKCTKFGFRWGSGPNVAGGAYNCPPRTVADGEGVGCPLLKLHPAALILAILVLGFPVLRCLQLEPRPTVCWQRVQVGGNSMTAKSVKSASRRSLRKRRTCCSIAADLHPFPPYQPQYPP